jgi:hypothetical protein
VQSPGNGHISPGGQGALDRNGGETMIKEYNFAKTLFEQQIFEWALKAKLRFPEVVEVSPR